jgi:hypothetical protein
MQYEASHYIHLSQPVFLLVINPSRQNATMIMLSQLTRTSTYCILLGLLDP